MRDYLSDLQHIVLVVGAFHLQVELHALYFTLLFKTLKTVTDNSQYAIFLLAEQKAFSDIT